jgi:hypothetical protein
METFEFCIGDGPEPREGRCYNRPDLGQDRCRRCLAEFRSITRAMTAARQGRREGPDFLGMARKLAAEKKLPLHEAMSAIARARPDVYEAHKRGLTAATPSTPDVDIDEIAGPDIPDVGADDGDFMQQARAIARRKGLPVYLAMGQLAAAQPELHRAYVNAARRRAGVRPR